MVKAADAPADRARWPLFVTVIAATCAMGAVCGAVISAVTAMTRDRDPCAGRDRIHA
jgi:hypothetical protein